MKNYLEESKRTEADTFFPELVQSYNLENLLYEMQLIGDDLSDVKKALYYGKSLEQPYLDFVEKDYQVDPVTIHGIVGVCTEAAELASLLRSALDDSKSPVKREEIIDEAGDVLWYLALLFRRFDTSFEEVASMNIAKLKKRFPDKFSTDAALNRDMQNENTVFQ